MMDADLATLAARPEKNTKGAGKSLRRMVKCLKIPPYSLVYLAY